MVASATVKVGNAKGVTVVVAVVVQLPFDAVAVYVTAAVGLVYTTLALEPL